MRVGLLLKRVLDLCKIFFTGRIFQELNEVKSKMNASIPKSHKVFPVEKQQNAKISVVVPTLNESAYIKNLILSLKANRYDNLEVIIVDCMSKDDTVAKARKLGAKVILSKKRNVGYQTHLGFMCAEGDIFVRTDADTIFQQDILMKIADTFKKGQAAVYHIGHLYYDGNILLNLLAHLYDKHWRKVWWTSGYFIAVRKSTYQRVGFKFLTRGEEHDFGKRAYGIFGDRAFVFDPNTALLVSARAIRKQGLLRYLLARARARGRTSYSSME